MKYLLVLLFAVFTIPVLAQTVINDKNVEVRSVSSFSGIKVSGGIDIYLSQSDEYALAVSASEDKFRDEIKTEINNGVLTISFNGGTFKSYGNKNLRAYISFKDLESIEASGACDITVNGNFKTNSVRMKLSGACEIKGAIEIDNVQLNLSGASTVKLSGTVQNLKIDASGASDVKNYDLIVDNCMANISGASDVKLTINKSISAKASGASSLYYKGNPDRKDVSTSGASSISSRN